jgi:hypothetical protein
LAGHTYVLSLYRNLDVQVTEAQQYGLLLWYACYDARF